MTINRLAGLCCASALLFTMTISGSPAYAQEVDHTSLAKKTQNPLSKLISVPLESNWYLNTGPRDKTEYVLNARVIYPISLNEDWNLIGRGIFPIISQPQLASGGDRESGLGDIVLEGFFSPVKPVGKLFWGIGPAISIPTATDDRLGSEKLSVGPSLVTVFMEGPWVASAIVQNIWSVAGDDDRDHVNQFLVQPFVNYNLKDGWYLTTDPLITANWNADDSDDRWTVPVGGGVGKIVKLGKLPVNLSFKTFYNVVKPGGGPNWQIQFQASLLFPKK